MKEEEDRLSMKFIHIADVHLGASPNAGLAYSGKRKQEIWDTFLEVLQRCNTEQVDLLLIAGDLFHRQPLLRELKEVNYMLSKLQNTEVVLIIGNHDYIKKDSYYRSFQWANNIHVILSEELTSIKLESLNTVVYGCSYYTKEVLRSSLEDDIEPEKGVYHILLGHGGDATHMPFQKNNFKDSFYDYIALGHIHKPQVLIPNKMYYAGALEPTDTADYGAHGYIKGELRVDNGEKNIQVDFHPIAKRSYIELEFVVNEQMTQYELKERLHAMIHAEGVQNLYRIRLVGKRLPDMQYNISQLDDIGNCIEIEDETQVYYDLHTLKVKNRDNLLGALIDSFGVTQQNSIEYMALYEGIEALEETKRR